MGPRPLVIMAVLGWLVGSTGLVQARGEHGAIMAMAGIIMETTGTPFPGLGSTAACGSSPHRREWRRRPRLGAGRRPAIPLAMTRWASILRCSHVPTRGGAPRP